MVGRFLRSVGNRTAMLVHACGPVDRGEWRAEKALSGSAIQHKKITVAGGLQHHLAAGTLEYSIDQDSNLDGIPIVGIVGRALESPTKPAFAVIGGHDATGPG